MISPFQGRLLGLFTQKVIAAFPDCEIWSNVCASHTRKNSNFFSQFSQQFFSRIFWACFFEHFLRLAKLHNSGPLCNGWCSSCSWRCHKNDSLFSGHHVWGNISYELVMNHYFQRSSFRSLVECSTLFHLWLQQWHRNGLQDRIFAISAQLFFELQNLNFYFSEFFWNEDDNRTGSHLIYRCQ